MKKFVLCIVLIAFAATAWAGPSRGILVPDKIPAPALVDPGALSVELATMQPLWSSGGSWSSVTVTAGLGWNLPQPNSALEVLTPDRLTGFAGRLGAQVGFDGEYAFGATLDWDVMPPYVQAYVGVLKGEGAANWSLGLKGTLFQKEF